MRIEKLAMAEKAVFSISIDKSIFTPSGQEIEIPLLLDPCVLEDVKLISFLGANAEPATTDPLKQEKVKVSSEIYNMNDPYIRSERRKVWDEVDKTISEYQSGAISRAACLRRLKAAVSREAQFSACAIACVNSVAPDEIIQELDLEL